MNNWLLIRAVVLSVSIRNYELYWHNEWPKTGTIEARNKFLDVMISSS